MTAPYLYWEDFPVGHITEFGDKLVDRDEIIDFASKFDPQPFHLNEEAGKNSLLGGLCASGWHTCAMAMRMVCDEYLLRSSSLGSPGLENLRWIKPVFPGDRLRLRFVVLDARPLASRPTVGMVRTRWEVINQHNAEVMTMESNAMFGRRPQA